ncbi:hypothetical protein H2198_003321 [Neophaeococcomyces mojaviensis]|uniref:Uncharacterized protein n=1 Tax=Neophaeococcomyces mojaviensis TaxID=3383035 RepID=A0ACC3ACP8_9EURO|nr:hypothetical protein H2198_003321 [Knufia sp. JES_112]
MAPHDLETGQPELEKSTRGRTLPVKLMRKKGKFISTEQIRLRNDLMLIVGYLEFFNALDFPANIWNTIPVPTFALALMIVGGTIALLASITAFWDLRRSLRNVRLLREERAYLQRELKIARSKGLRIRECHIVAWLKHNFRELGWELVDRSCMDALVGFAAILVGTGTLMATGGANHRIYVASNLLSGYIGNGFVAVYGLINAVWSAYLYVRARRHKALVKECISDKSMKKRGVEIFRNHEAYALINGTTLLVSSAGSLISTTMWWGYVMLIPCILASVYCNILWRSKVGYYRILSHFRTSEDLEFNISAQILDSSNVQAMVKNGSVKTVLDQSQPKNLLEFIYENEMHDDVSTYLANEPPTRRALGIKPTDAEVVLDVQDLMTVEFGQLLEAVKACVAEVGFCRALDRERMLFELLGSYLTVERAMTKQEAMNTRKNGERGERRIESKERAHHQPESYVRFNT